MTGTRSPRLFFDAHCRPCTFWARLTSGLSRSELAVFPLDSPEADRALGSMTPSRRYAYFHIVEAGKTVTGPDALPVWVGLLGGATARALVEKVPPVDRLLRQTYDRFWEYRRTRGCDTGDARNA